MVVDLSQYKSQPHPEEGPVTTAFRRQMGHDGAASPQVESFAARNPAAMQELMFLAQRVSMGPEQQQPDIPVLNSFVAGFFTGVFFREAKVNGQVETFLPEPPSPLACPNCDEVGELFNDKFTCPHCTYTEDRS